MSRSLGIPLELLHEAAGHAVTVELKTDEVYRGSMVECDDNWNCQLDHATFTAKFGLAYVAPQSRVVAAGDLVDEPNIIGVHYLRGYFLLDFFLVLPLPQVPALQKDGIVPFCFPMISAALLDNCYWSAIS